MLSSLPLYKRKFLRITAIVRRGRKGRREGIEMRVIEMERSLRVELSFLVFRDDRDAIVVMVEKEFQI